MVVWIYWFCKRTCWSSVDAWASGCCFSPYVLSFSIFQKTLVQSGHESLCSLTVLYPVSYFSVHSHKDVKLCILKIHVCKLRSERFFLSCSGLTQRIKYEECQGWSLKDETLFCYKSSSFPGLKRDKDTTFSVFSTIDHLLKKSKKNKCTKHNESRGKWVDASARVYGCNESVSMLQQYGDKDEER